MLSQAVLIAAVIDLIGVNINGRVVRGDGLFHTLTSHFASLLSPPPLPDRDSQTAQRNPGSNHAFPVTRGE